MLEKLTEENEELRRLARRVEIVSAFAEEDLQKFRDRTQVERILLQDRLKAERQKRIKNRAERTLRREEGLAEALRTLSEAKLSALENVASAMHVDDENLGENVVADVYQAGFVMGDKVLRFATVRVAN